MTATRLFLTILFAGMGLRVCWVLAIPVEPVSDSWAYHQFARTLVEHGVYGWTSDEPTAYWAVGTPALVAFTYLFTESYAGVVVLNLFASIATLVLSYHLAARWFGAKTALWAMALIAFWPNLIYFTTIVSSELFFISMTLGGLFFWRRPAGNTMLNLIFAGLFWGLTAYIRPVILLVPLALALVDLAHGPRRFAIAAFHAGVSILLIVLVTLPWSIRNHQVFGELVMVSSNFGPNFWMGNNPLSDGGYMDLPSEVADMDEIERSDYLTELAKEYIWNNPAEAIQLMGKKLVKLHARETIGVVWNESGLHRLAGDDGVLVAKLLATAYWYCLVFIGLAGIFILAWKAGIVPALFNQPVALWAYFISLHTVVVAGDRYHMPASAFIAIMAAVALSELPGRLSRQSTST
jgi:4-amino-4-deoxy-L-arabinose transferase-like glycosyltransferase